MTDHVPAIKVPQEKGKAPETTHSSTLFFLLAKVVRTAVNFVNKGR